MERVPNRAPFLASIIAGIISQSGNLFAAIAIPWYVLATTGSAAKMGIVGFFQLVPTVIAAVFGGALADRVGHKRISVLADIVSGVSVAAIPLLDYTVGLRFWELLALVFFGAVIDAPGSTARQAIFPDLIELGGVSLERANGIGSMVQGITSLLVPPLAGVSIAWFGASRVLWLDAISFFVSAALYWAVVPSFRHHHETNEPYWDQVLSGLRFLRASPTLFTITVIAAAINLLTAPLYGIVLAVLAKDAYGSSKALGWMLGAQGAGALASLLLYSARGDKWPRRQTVLLGFMLFSLPTIVVALVHHLWIAVAAMAITGVGLGPINPVVFTILQERTPAAMRGRVFGGVTAAALVASPLGYLVGGSVVEQVGPRPVIFGIGVLLSLFATPVAFLSSLREMDRPKPAAT